MNRKQLTILVVLGVILGALGWLALKKKGETYRTSTLKMGERVLPDFPLNDVAQFTVRHSTNQVNLVQTDTGWTVKERGGYPANFNNVHEFLRKVWELKIAKPVTVGPSRLPQLELTAPEKGAATQVEFRGKEGKLINTLLLGAKSMKESSGNSPFGGGGWPDGRYLMVDTNLQSVALVSETFANIEPKPEDWLNKDFFKVEKHKSISVTATNATNSFKLVRETEAGEWKLADAKPGEKLDTGKSSSVTSALSYPSFNDVAAGLKADEAGFQKGVTAVLETFENFTYTVKAAPKPGGDDYYLQVSVAGSFAKERTAGTDEKPEDKARLDKEFADNLKKLEDRLTADKKLGDWIYVVSKWTVDPLLKARHELLEEKKEEPKKEEPKKEEPKTEAKDVESSLLSPLPPPAEK
jgi:hypothetical protein